MTWTLAEESRMGRSHYNNNNKITDHLIFAIQIPINKPIIRKIRTHNRLKLTKDILELENCTLTEILDYIKEYSKKYLVERKANKIQLDLNNFKLPADINNQVKIWNRNFQTFAKDIINLRFSPLQGYAFRVIKQLTKYDHYIKRDGSVITIIKKEDGTIITQENEVNCILIDTLKKREQELTKNHRVIVIKKPEALDNLDTDQILSFSARISSKKSTNTIPSTR